VEVWARVRRAVRMEVGSAVAAARQNKTCCAWSDSASTCSSARPAPQEGIMSRFDDLRRRIARPNSCRYAGTRKPRCGRLSPPDLQPCALPCASTLLPLTTLCGHSPSYDSEWSLSFLSPHAQPKLTDRCADHSES